MSNIIPVPENDWIALNIAIEDLSKKIDGTKKLAVTSSGYTISELEQLNKSVQEEINPTPTPTPPPSPIPTPQLPVINLFSIEPTSAPQNALGVGYCNVTVVTVSWDIANGTKYPVLVRTPLISGSPVNLTLMKQSGQNSYTVAQKTSWLLKAKNDSGEVASPELLFDIYTEPPPVPGDLPVPENFTGYVQNNILFWTWNDVNNTDHLWYELFASKTPNFDPDKNPPTDMIKRISYGNQTNIVTLGTTSQTWYGKLRQVAGSGKSAFTPEYANTSYPEIPPIPGTLLPPANVIGEVSGRILFWHWDPVSNADRKFYQFYASKTTGFDPDGTPPADMKYRITFGNQTNIVAGGAGETWYGIVRQVAVSGVSSFSPEVANISV